MIVFAAALAVAAFLIAFQAFGIVGAAKSTITLAGDAGKVMRDGDLSDDQKETAIQRAALSMLRASGSIFLRVAATLIATVVPVYFLDLIGLVDAGAVFGFLARPDVIIGTSVLVAGGVWLYSRRPKSQSDYSTMDRFVHKLAFAAPFVQMTAADMEDSVFKSQIAEIKDKPPVFVTSLPRAGTTVVLNALHDVPGVATHIYRDMPFLMAPLIWSKISGGFQKDASLSERAHGDGIKVGFDSPEAFEEVIWRHFWPDHYKGDVIALWSQNDRDAEATEFFRAHFRKIVALRTGPGGRYVSKNNGNIARLDLLGQMFPGAGIVVPLRNPAEQAASLLRQHQNFLSQHDDDPFVKRYMQDIGHLEFGELHRPIEFPGFAELSRDFSPEQPDYWLAYWISAYLNVSEHVDDLMILPETGLQADGQATMVRLCEKLALDPGDTDFSGHFRTIEHRADLKVFDKTLLDRAMSLYADLGDAGRKALRG